jgi:Tol biopolymer transport system component/predicted Ser/Thr protein kinase
MVAVKVVLPQHLSSSADVRQRFEREAKTISQLSHPHICALYDVGREADLEYLVMEYLEGETLTERLAKGPLPLDQTLRFGTEIANALERAHRQGIVHRDLKPGNVMLTKSGVKLLDFGLAKALPSPGGRGDGGEGLTSLPTQQNLTQEGTILGTFQYMAPEQLEGKDADARTDIFALGATLYEMATGKKAFAASSQASLITAIMSSDPAPISSVQPMSPPVLDRIVRTCLAKDPEDRWQSARDVASQLQWIREGSGAGAAVGARPRRARRQTVAWAVAALALGAPAALLLLQTRGGPADAPVALTAAPPPGSGITLGNQLAISPDGRTLLLQGNDGQGELFLYSRSLDSTSLRKLEGTARARFPFWSADGGSIAFFEGGKLRRMDADGGTARTICDAGYAFGGAWTPDDRILFGSGFGKGLSIVAASGGEPKTLTTLDTARGDVTHLFPVVLPGGGRFVFLARNIDPEKTSLVLGDLESSETRILRRSDSSAAVSPEGYLLFALEGSLFAQRIDLRAGALSGEPVEIVKNVLFQTDSGDAGFAAGARTLVYGLWETDRRLEWVDRRGTVLGALRAPDKYDDVAISPDGRRAAYSLREAERGQNLDVWVAEVDRGTASRVTTERSDDFHPVWTPDGESLIYTSDRAGFYDLYRRPAAGGPEEVVIRNGWDKIASDVTKDGSLVLFTGSPRGQAEDLWTAPLSGKAEPRPLVESERFAETLGRFSPDGYVAFVSDESGRPEVYVRPVGGGPKRLVSNAGGWIPVWRRDGKELFYSTLDGRLTAVAVSAGPSSLHLGVPQPLFDLQLADANAFSPAPYDVSADGLKFLVVRRGSEANPGYVVSLNWTSRLPK